MNDDARRAAEDEKRAAKAEWQEALVASRLATDRLRKAQVRYQKALRALREA